ncbi:MAG TPA: hypothetical protein VL117_05940 [Thermoleophilia bacterium]|nr:hypothetical protein [Thermoleophilia bacterium]
MSATTHTYRLVQVPIAWIVWFIVVMAIIVIASVAVIGWQLSSTTSGTAPVQIRLAPAPMPGPVAELARLVVS